MKNIWIVEWIEQKIMKKIAGWLDGQKKYKDGWMDIKMYGSK